MSARAFLGLEHEYRVVSTGGSLDFRLMIHNLALGQAHLDPGDPNAYRLPSGAVLTADGAEAEIALPPVPVQSGFSVEVVERAQSARSQLVQVLPDKLLDGYSTHLSVSVPNCVADRVAREYIATFAPAMMLLLDRLDSPGLLVRPRPGRLELGGEYVDGRALQVAAAFAAGSVRACIGAVTGERVPDVERVAATVVPDDHRYGWFVSRTAFGEDLYADGRAAWLSVSGGGRVRAQQHLERCLHAALNALGDLAADSDVDVLMRTVVGQLPLPLEVGEQAQEMIVSVRHGSVFGDVLAWRRRDAFEVVPVMATWDTTVVLAIEPSSGRRVFVNVPREDLPSFLDALDRGELDAEIVRRLRRRLTRRTLARHSQTTRFGYFDRLGSRQRLLPKERRPMAPANSRL